MNRPARRTARAPARRAAGTGRTRRMRAGTAFGRLQTFARLLGWPDLRQLRHQLQRDPEHPTRARHVTWYESGDLNTLGLLISQYPVGQHENYLVSAFAPQYRLASGYHEFSLIEETVMDAVRRLSDWVGRPLFETLPARRRYRMAHPECAGWSWRRIEQERRPIHYRDGSLGT